VKRGAGIGAAVLLFLLLAWGCAPKRPVAPAVARVPSDVLFLQAEKAYREKAYEEAYPAYRAFVEQYPGEPLAPAALMKMAAIHRGRGEPDRALDLYRRVREQYPGSPFLKDAQLEGLAALLEARRYGELVSAAAPLMDRIPSGPDRIRLLWLQGDAYLGLGSPLDAFYFYERAIQRAGEAERAILLVRLNTAVESLDASQLEFLLGHIQEPAARSLLLYRLGLLYARQDLRDPAVKALTEFLEAYPSHELRGQAEMLLADIGRQVTLRPDTLGCLLPLSGPFEIYGRLALRGIELAAHQAAASGRRSSPRFLVRDTGGEPGKALQGLRELHEEGVAGIIGPMAAAEAVAAEAQRLGIPIIALSQKEGLPAAGDFVFRHFLTADSQAAALVDYAVRRQGLTRFAILYPDEAYGQGFMNLFWDEVLAAGATVTAVEAYDPSETDFAGPIRKLVGMSYPLPEDIEQEYIEQGIRTPGKKTEGRRGERHRREEETNAIVDFEAVFIPDAPRKAGLIIPQLLYHDIEGVLLLGPHLWHSSRFIQMADPYVQGAVFSEAFFAESREPEVRSFVKSFEAAYGEKPSLIEALAYDTAWILIEAGTGAEIRSRRQVRDRVAGIGDFRGATGVTRFDAAGEAKKRLRILRISGSGFEELPGEGFPFGFSR